MVRPFRTLKILPTHLIIPSSIPPLQKNTEGVFRSVHMIFAYRKVRGNDRRVRMLVPALNIMGDRTLNMFYLDTPKSKPVPIEAGIDSLKCFDNIGSERITEWVFARLNSPETNFVAGETYSVGSFRFALLSEYEMDILSTLTLQHDVLGSTETFLY